MGPLMLDLTGYELDAEEREILQHPTVGGVIFFSRNYHDREQLRALTRDIRNTVKRPFLLSVDQEGGRVQRFRNEFTSLPPAQAFAESNNGIELASQAGWLMAAELLAMDIDISFAPVLDLGFACKAIGDRAFADSPSKAIEFARQFITGMKDAGMATTGKHFPGHGGVIADSHFETPVDPRDNILEHDMQVFKTFINENLLDAMMPAHVIFEHYDASPASGSKFWLQEVLRKQLQFDGVIFSDDLNMKGADVMGSYGERALATLQAGCDMAVLCNNRAGAIEAIDELPQQVMPRLNKLLKAPTGEYRDLVKTQRWKDSEKAIERLTQEWKDKA